MAKKKMRFDELMASVAPEKKTRKPMPRVNPNKRSSRNVKPANNRLDVELIRVWCPHLIACDFDRARAVQLAFPTKEWTELGAKQFADRLIAHPMFTEIIANHIDALEDRMANSERYVLDKLYRQAEANIYDYFREDDKGRMTAIPKSELPKHLQQNVKKMKITNKLVDHMGSKKLYEQQIELEIVDSFRAVALLGKNMGMFIERVELDFGKQTADRLEAALTRARERKLHGGHERVTDQSRPARPIH